MRPLYLAILLLPGFGLCQAPKQYLDQSPPSASTRLVTLKYTNSFDGGAGEALVELPPEMKAKVPLIVTSHGANWTQEMNRSVWTGVADQFGVIVLYPRHQGALNPRVSMGSAKQMANLESAVTAAVREYPVDEKRIYAGGISQGGLETLLLLGHNPSRYAGGLAINPLVDFFAFHDQLKAFLDTHPEPATDPLDKLRQGQWAALLKLTEFETGGTPDTSRAEYYLRSPAFYAREIARVPLILYWAEDDELIPNGATHQGGMLAGMLRKLGAPSVHEVKHTGGHGYPFYRVDLAKMQVSLFPRDIFISSVRELLQYPK
jgi:dipeptidyl aminopeptidase/acylaminoacyl peptidase